MRSLVLKQYVVDAFTDKVFSGNPAAVCVLEQWLPDHLMMNIANILNKSENIEKLSTSYGVDTILDLHD